MLAFRFAGLTFELSSGESSSGLRLPECYSGFLIDHPATKAEAVYRILDPASDRLRPLATSDFQWHCDAWRMGRVENDRFALELHSIVGDRWIPVANVESDFSAGEIRPLVGRKAEPSPYALNYPYDQVLLLNRLLHFGAGVVHACGVVAEGQGLIFCGRSGVGKTTIARLWKAQDARLLNDDRSILRVSGTDILLESSPWNRKSPSANPESVPLRAIVHLRQAPENRLRRMDGARPLTSLLATSVAPFYSESGMEKLIETWAQVVERVPSYRLDFTPDTRPVELCRRELLDT
jgi:hypothetical protein